MAIKGSLGEASLPDVLQLLGMGQKTGCLSVTDRARFGYIYFERGRITYAAIVNRRDRLGDLLVKNGLVEPAELAAAIDAQAQRPARRLGEILIERGVISAPQLEQYIRLQIEEAVYHLFTWTQGSFYFEAERRPEGEPLLVSISPENVLLEGARRIDEWSLIEKKIPSFDLVFARDPAHPPGEGVELTPEQRRLLPLLDGRRSVQELADESALVEFEVGKALFGLIQAGFVQPVGRRQPADASPAAGFRVHEHRNLGLAFYKTAMLEEAQREFRRVVELQPQHLEARYFLALILLRQRQPRRALRLLRELVEVGGARPAVFHAMALGLEQLGRLPEAQLALQEALRRAPDAAPLLLSRAVLQLKAGAPAAHAAFAEYRTALGDGTPPPAAYFVFAVLAAAVAGRADEALRLGEEGLALYPRSGALLLHLGGVRERRGEWAEAEALYRRAAEEAPELPQAHKSLGDALYRRGTHDEAAAAYARALQLAPALGDDAYLKLGNVHYKALRRDEALRCWREAIRLNPENAVARTNLDLVENVLP